MAISNLHIKKIRVENYKSLKASEIEFKEGLNIIIGKNGAGKSNMLDFVYRYGSRTPFSFSFRNIRTSNANYSVTLQYLNKRVKNIFSYSF